MTPPTIRPATEADIPAIRALLTAYGNDDAPQTRLGPDIVGPYVGHVLHHHRMLVATAGGSLVAFGGVVFAGLAAHLADLFVVPELLGQGIGSRLLDALFAGTGARTTFASSDPRAIPAYVRAGMRPRWPLLYLEGPPDAVERTDPGGHTVRPATPEALSELEAAWTGSRRPADHAFWGSQAGASSFLVLDETALPVAAGYARGRQASPTSRAIDRLVIAPGADPVAPVLSAVHAALGTGSVVLTLPGPHPALPVLLACGFRIVDQNTYMAGPYDSVGTDRLLPNNGML